MDIVVALDSSTDVSSLQWAHQKQFVRNILNSFTMSEDATHVGKVAYSIIPSIQSKLDEKNSQNDVIKSIQVSNHNHLKLYERFCWEGINIHSPIPISAPRWSEAV